MPAFDLAHDSQILQRDDVIGQRFNLTPSFVVHVGLHDADEQKAVFDTKVTAVHMRPPLRQGSVVRTHVAGCVPLTNDEIKEVAAWIQEVDDEYSAAQVGKKGQYHIYPHAKDITDPNRGVRRYRRYSCAGFVLDGYAQVEIDLLALDDSLPEIGIDLVIDAYPSMAQDADQLAEFGIQGYADTNKKWRIVLPGYVVNALNRSSEEIRRQSYRARSGDERF